MGFGNQPVLPEGGIVSYIRYAAETFAVIDDLGHVHPAFREQVFFGNPEVDKEILREASPVFHVDKIKAPLLIAQGVNDPRVAKSESDQIVEALKERGIDVPYIVKNNEGHGFHNEENRFEFFKAMEEFFGKYLGGKIEKVN